MARAHAAPPELRAGDLLDRYELIYPVAEGGMGTVWLARIEGKHGFEKLVAVKTILPSYAWERKFQRMFLDEARIASGVVHPNVAQILDLGEHQGLLYFAMEWVDGDPLRAVMKALDERAVPLPTALALRLAADICGGLHAAHEARSTEGAALGIVHRDVSPQNLLVTGGGVIKLIDFGIAKARGRAASETAIGEVKGKARYMAPEQALGCQVDRRADVWAAGAVLYEMIVGRPLSRARTPVEAVKEMLEGYPREPFPPWVPPAVAQAVDGALSADLDARTPTAEALQREIEAAALSTGLTASAGDVGDFIRIHLGHLLEGRRRFLEAALSSAARRKSTSAIRTVPAGRGSSPPPSTTPTVPASPPPPVPRSTIRKRATPPPLPPKARGARAVATPTAPSAAVATPPPAPPRAGSMPAFLMTRRGRTGVVVAFVAMACAIALLTLVVVGR